MTAAIGINILMMADAQKLIPTTDEKGRAGYADESGKIVIPCTYEAVFPFHNGRARVQKGGKQGIIDESGKLLLPCKYEKIRRVGPGKPYCVVTGGKYGLIDSNNFATIIPCKYSYISKFNSYGMAWIAAGGKIKDGKIVGAKYGTASLEGVCVPAKYVVLAEFCGRSQLGMIGNHSYMPENLTGVLSDTLQGRAEYMAFHKLATLKTFYGLLDKEGKILIKNNKVMYISVPRQGMARTWNKKKKNYICSYYDIVTKKFMEVTELPIAESDTCSMVTHGDFLGNVAPVRSSYTSWKIINRQAESIGDNFSKIKFGRGHERGEGMMAGLNSKGYYQFYDSEGEEFLQGTNYTDIVFPDFTQDDSEVFIVKKSEKWGAVERSNRVRLPFEYDRILTLRHGLFTVNKHGRWGMVTDENREYVPCNYEDIILNSESNPQYVWVGQRKGVYEVYNVRAKRITSSSDFSNVRNFEGDYAWAYSQKNPLCCDASHECIAKDTAMTHRVQSVIARHAAATNMDEQQIRNSMGNIYNTSGQPCFSFIIPAWLYREAAELARKNNGVVPVSRQRQFLLKYSSAEEKISMKAGRISEGYWDF